MKKSEEKTLKIGQIVNHKTQLYYNERMIILRFIDEDKAEVRYFNEATKKFTLAVFYKFELEEVRNK